MKTFSRKVGRADHKTVKPTPPPLEPPKECPLEEPDENGLEEDAASPAPLPLTRPVWRPSYRGKRRPAGQGYPRKALTEVEQHDAQRYIAEMRSHFKEVDAFELEVESPVQRASHSQKENTGEGSHQPGSRQSYAALGFLQAADNGSNQATPTDKRQDTTIARAGPTGQLPPLQAPSFGLSRRCSVCCAPEGAAASAAAPVPSFGLSRRSSVCFAPEALAQTRASGVPGLGDADRRRQPRPSTLAGTAIPESPEDAQSHASPVAEKADEDENEAAATPSTSQSPQSSSDPHEAGDPHEAENVQAATSAQQPGSIPEADSRDVPPSPVPPTGFPVAMDGHAPEKSSGGEVEDLTAVLGSKLTLDDKAAVIHASHEEPQLTDLQQLLLVCGQEVDVASIPSMDDILTQHVDLAQVRKCGEGTFGEAFREGEVVIKIVPFDGETPVNGEVQKRSAEIKAEIAVGLTLSQLRGTPGSRAANETNGFVQMHGVGICRGRYSPTLLEEWHAWDRLHVSENNPVGCFPADQLYVVFVVADGGVDLEKFVPRSHCEATSILVQCAMMLAIGEEACQLEHRDLHWGNILIQRQPKHLPACRLRGVDVEMGTHGLAVTLIDFTLSRLQTLTGEVAFCDLGADPDLFKGPRGDCQADTYRRMKKATKNKWQAFTPATNTLWMHYLADLFLNQKQYPSTAEEKQALRTFRKQCLAYASCTDMVLADGFLSGLWHSSQ